MLKVTDRYIKYKLENSVEINKYASEDIINLSTYHYTMGWDRSNQGGWQAHYTDIKKLEWMQHLDEAIITCAKQIVDDNNPRSEFDLHTYYWLNLNYYGTNNSPHHHSKATYTEYVEKNDEMKLTKRPYAPEILSGAYYVKVPENSGRLYFREKRYAYLNNLFNTDYDTKIDVSEGEAIFFWPDILHGVERNNNKEEPRISIAFNIGIRPVGQEHVMSGFDCVND